MQRSAAGWLSMRATFRFLLGKRSMRHVLIGAALASVTMNGLGQFWGRFFVSVHHATLTETGRAIGILAIVTMITGFSLGGFGVERAGRRDPRWYVWGPRIALLLSSPLLLLGETRDTVSGTVSILLIALTLLFVYFTPTLAIAQNMVSANMRASSAFFVAAVLGIQRLGCHPLPLRSAPLSRRPRYALFRAARFGLVVTVGCYLAFLQEVGSRKCSAPWAAHEYSLAPA